MGTKKTGLSPELVIHPGETIADILEDRGISQAELATCTGNSTAYISNVISGKKGISSRFALSLEYALGVPKSFWLNLQANYEAELLELQEYSTITDEERNVRAKLEEIVSYLRKKKDIPSKLDLDGSILALRKALRISNIANLNKCIPENSSGTDPKRPMNDHAVGAWVRICQKISLEKSSETPFQKENYERIIQESKELFKNDSFSDYGIEYSFVEKFSDTPIDGYIIKRPGGSYFLALTERKNNPQDRLRAILKEAENIVNGKMKRSNQFIDYSQA